MLHNMTEKMVYLDKSYIQDLKLVIDFLCTGVKYTENDDWKKLIRVMRYILSAIELPLILGIYDRNTLHWYIDATFGVHPDMNSHTGMTTNMGKGAARSNSTKHKFSTKS